MGALKHELAFFRGWLAWLFVVKMCPARFVLDLPGWLLGWAGFYAYDRRHEANTSTLEREGP